MDSADKGKVVITHKSTVEKYHSEADAADPDVEPYEVSEIEQSFDEDGNLITEESNG